MFKLPKGALYIVNVLQKNNHQSYIVGGGLRDVLLGLPVFDWDIATDASPDRVTALFEKVVPTGIDFGTVTIMLDDGQYEVTTFRKDERYTDGRRPEKVTFSKSIEEDLCRRDFTINAMAYDPAAKQLLDPYNGQSDLKAKLIRAVGEPLLRFREDGLRCLRACRFAAKLDFQIEKNTLAAIPEALNIFKKVSPERVHDELVKMMSADKPSIGIEYMRNAGLLDIVIPELTVCAGVEQPKPFHAYDVYYHSLYSCDHAPKSSLTVRLAGLLHDIAKPATKKEDTFYDHDNQGAEAAEVILKRLKFSNDDISAVKNLIKNHMFNYTSGWSDSAVRRFIRRVGIDNIKDLFLLRNADMKAMEREIDADYIAELQSRIDKVIKEQNALSVSQLKVNGGDVMKTLNVGPGPKVGEVLNSLLEKVLDDPALNERDRLIGLIKTSK